METAQWKILLILIKNEAVTEEASAGEGQREFGTSCPPAGCFQPLLNWRTLGAV